MMTSHRRLSAIGDSWLRWQDRISKVSDILMFGLAGLWCAVLFGIYSWPAWEQSFGVAVLIVIDPYFDLSDKSSWLPLAMEVAKGRFFPLTSTSGDALNGLSYYPYLSLWLLAALVTLLGPGLALAAAQILFPTAVFILCALTFHLYLPRRWALSLAALGTMAYSSYPLREFLVEMVTGTGWRQLGTVFRPDLANMPFPAISALAFVAVFYLTMRNQRLSGRWITGLTVAWALQTQVHIVNALFGIPFWLTYLLLRLWRQRRIDGNETSDVMWIWGTQAAITALVSLPAIVGLAGWVSPGVGATELFGGAGSGSSILSGYYFTAYFVLPVALTALVATVWRIDPFEILTRFWPIILFMGVELLLALLNLFTGTGALTELMFSRIGIFFLHMLYFVPLVHYAVRPHSSVAFSSGIERNSLAAHLRTFLRWLLHDASLIYLPLLFVALTQFAVASGKQALEFQDKRQPRAAEVQARLDLLARQHDKEKFSVADEYLATNLNLHLKRGHASLVNNRFANQIGVEDALERLVLYARAVGWSESEFLGFMLAEAEYRGPHLGQVFDWTTPASARGLGYWLLFHQRYLTRDEGAELETHLRQLFATLDVALVAKRVDLRYILSSRAPAAELGPSPMAVTPFGTLYGLKLSKVDR